MAPVVSHSESTCCVTFEVLLSLQWTYLPPLLPALNWIYHKLIGTNFIYIYSIFSSALPQIPGSTSCLSFSSSILTHAKISLNFFVQYHHALY